MPASLSRKWVDIIHHAEGKFANWDPDIQIKVGEYGTIDRETGEFQRAGNVYNNPAILEEVPELKDYPPTETAKGNNWVIQSEDTKCVKSDSTASVDDPEPMPGFKERWSFAKGKVGGFLAMPLPYIKTSFPREISEKKLIQLKQLDGMALVTDTWTTQAFARYMSDKSGSEFELTVNPTIITDPEVSPKFTTSHHSGIYREGYRPQISTPFTTLFKAKKAKIKIWTFWRDGSGGPPPGPLDGVDKFEDTPVPWDPLDEDGEEDPIEYD